MSGVNSLACPEQGLTWWGLLLSRFTKLSHFPSHKQYFLLPPLLTQNPLLPPDLWLWALWWALTAMLLRGHYYTTVGFVGFHPITVNIDVRFCSLRDSEREEDKEAVIVLWGYYGPMLNRHQSIHMIYHQTRLWDTKLITLGSQYYQKTRAQNIGGKEQPGTIIQSCQWRVMMVPPQHST